MVRNLEAVMVRNLKNIGCFIVIGSGYRGGHDITEMVAELSSL